MYSPKTIMYGDTLHYKRHLALKIGQYCQVHEEDTQRNDQAAMRKSAICLGPSGNTQGVFKFMSIHLETNINRRSWDSIPIPDTIIARVNEIEKGEPETFIFTDCKVRIIGDSELTGVDTSVNQEPQKNQLPNDIEVTPYI